MYDIIDEKTRFVLATRITYTRTTHDAEMLMERAEKRAAKNQVVITDKQASYNDGIELAYVVTQNIYKGRHSRQRMIPRR